MTKRFALLMVAGSMILAACSETSSGPDDLTYINENGEEVSVEIATGSFKDPRDGTSYKTVTIGEKTWMAENLTYSGGDVSSSDEKYSWGAAQVACPEGWHLALRDEWQDLFEDIEKVYGDSAGWALKSTSGWDSDTTDGEVVSGNGKDILGFNIKPTGICRGSDCRYQGNMTGFWTMSKVDRDGYADYIRFDVDPSWHPGEIYRDARLHVRCVSDKNTIFESLGKCTEEKDGSVGEHKSSFYICKDGFWETASMEEKLNFVMGECNAEIKGKRFVMQDTSYMCSANETTTYVWGTCGNDVVAPGETCTESGWVDTVFYAWTYTPKDSILADCKAAGDTICQFRDSTFRYDSFMGYWYEARIYEVKKCSLSNNGETVLLNKLNYICQDSSWSVANEASMSEGLCDESRQYDTVTVKVSGRDERYICVGKRWYRQQWPEDSLGFCFNNGEKGTYRNTEFICDASEHLWYHHFVDSRDNREYRSTFIYGMLVMAENLKYGGDSLYLWHEAMQLDESCDSLYCAEESYDTTAHQGICPDGWELLTHSEAEYMLNAYDYTSTFAPSLTDDDIDAALSKENWLRSTGNNRSGLNFSPHEIDTTFVMETYVISSSSYQTTLGSRQTDQIESIKYRASTWLSKESTGGSWWRSNKAGDDCKYAYQLGFYQTSNGISIYQAMQNDTFEKKKKAPVRCKKKINL